MVNGIISNRFWRLLASLTACFAIGAAAQSPSQDQSHPAAEESVVFAAPELETINRFLGPWNVKQTHFDAKGEVVARTKGTEEISWLLDRRVLRRAFTIESGDTVYRAIGTLTWNGTTQQYEGFWFDNHSLGGPVTVTAEWQADTSTMIFTHESLDESGSKVTHRTVDRFIDEENREAATYLLDGSRVKKLFVTYYKRAKPCPANQIRGHFGG